MKTQILILFALLFIFSSCYDKDINRVAENGDLERLKELLNQGYDVNYFSYDKSILMSAAQGGNLEIVKYLVKKAAVIDTATVWTALGFASANGYLDIVKYLIEQGADVNIKGSFSSPLISAAKKK